MCVCLPPVWRHSLTSLLSALLETRACVVLLSLLYSAIYFLYIDIDYSCCCCCGAACNNSDVTLCTDTSDCTQLLPSDKCAERGSSLDPERVNETINSTCRSHASPPTHCCCVVNSALDTSCVSDCQTGVEINISLSCDAAAAESCSFSLDVDTYIFSVEICFMFKKTYM